MFEEIGSLQGADQDIEMNETGNANDNMVIDYPADDARDPSEDALGDETSSSTQASQISNKGNNNEPPPNYSISNPISNPRVDKILDDIQKIYYTFEESTEDLTLYCSQRLLTNRNFNSESCLDIIEEAVERRRVKYLTEKKYSKIFIFTSLSIWLVNIIVSAIQGSKCRSEISKTCPVENATTGLDFLMCFRCQSKNYTHSTVVFWLSVPIFFYLFLSQIFSKGSKSITRDAIPILVITLGEITIIHMAAFVFTLINHR